MSIHILDDDSLFNVFCLYRPFFLGEGEDDDECLHGRKVGWVRGRWWYKLAHVCQVWRNLSLAYSRLRHPSYLDICLVCIPGTPVADMLATPLPLIIDHVCGDCDVSEDEGLPTTCTQAVRSCPPCPPSDRLFTEYDL
jgi:hypothetical protein